MRKIPLLCLVAAGAALGADFKTGLEAYHRGDFAAALQAWQPIAEGGDPHAQYNLGLLHARGQGVAQDYVQAARWYEKAAEQGVPAAQYNLGVMFANGQGVAASPEQAAKWFLKAAEQGVTDAQTGLGSIYQEGEGGFRNYAEAEKWYRKAAEQGVANAAFHLGVMYDLGQGVQRDYAEAMKWYRKAADGGYPGAMANLGILYYNAQGVKRDLVEAYAWFERAQRLGDPRAGELLNATARKMKPGEVKKAQALAAQWGPPEVKGRTEEADARLFKPPPEAQAAPVQANAAARNAAEPSASARSAAELSAAARNASEPSAAARSAAELSASARNATEPSASARNAAELSASARNATEPSAAARSAAELSASARNAAEPPAAAGVAPRNPEARPAGGTNAVFSDVGRIVAVGDLHGDYEQFTAVLASAGLIDGNGDWVGGKAHLVQTGDVVDRGPDSRPIMDLLMKLERQAAAAGGAVHALIGNHEAMNVYGDLRYVSPGELASYAQGAAAEFSYAERAALTETAKPSAGGAAPAGNAAGFAEHRAAFAPDGVYGRWIRSHNAAVKINRTLFLHAGLGRKYAGWTIDRINDEVRRELGDFTRLHGGVVTGEEGPLWDRGLASGNEAEMAPLVEDLLRSFDVDRIVVGHTYAQAAITPRFGGKVVLIDIGLSRVYDNVGKMGCLEIDGDRVAAIHRGQRLELPTDQGPDLLRYLRTAAALDPAPSPLLPRIRELEK